MNMQCIHTAGPSACSLYPQLITTCIYMVLFHANGSSFIISQGGPRIALFSLRDAYTIGFHYKH